MYKTGAEDGVEIWDVVNNVGKYFAGLCVTTVARETKYHSKKSNWTAED